MNYCLCIPTYSNKIQFSIKNFQQHSIYGFSFNMNKMFGLVIVLLVANEVNGIVKDKEGSTDLDYNYYYSFLSFDF